MDETSPVYQNFLNRMKFSRPIREATRRISASKFLQRDGDTGAKMDMPSTVRNIDKKINHSALGSQIFADLQPHFPRFVCILHTNLGKWSFP